MTLKELSAEELIELSELLYRFKVMIDGEEDSLDTPLEKAINILDNYMK